MHISSNPANNAQLRRVNIENERSEKSSKDSVLEPANAPQNSDPAAAKDGQVLEQLADKASEEFKFGEAANDKKISGGLLDSIKDILSEDAAAATDDRAAELFEEVDTENPTLTANEGGFDVKSSQGPENSTYIDLGDGAEVFVITDATGQQIAYRVENGELGERIPVDGHTNIGNGITVSIDESPTGDSEVNFQRRERSFPNPFRPDPKMTLNSDNSMLTTKERESGGFLNIGTTEVNSFDIQSGEQLVTDGVADLDKMSPQQQFDYYADTPQGAKILRAEGSRSYSGSAEKMDLFLARVRFDRGEGGPELFHDFNVDRAQLSGDELLAYDAQVNKILENATFTSHTAADGLQPMSDSMSYLIASGMVETMGTNPAVIDSALAELTGGFMVSLDDSFIDAASPNAGGVFMHSGTTPTGDQDIGVSDGLPKVLFRASSLVSNRADATDTYSIIAHEVAHVLDVDRSIPGWYDSILVGMSPEQAAEVTQIADDMLAANAADPTNNFGLSDYMFSRGKVEFISEATEFFLSGDEGAFRLYEASPELYAILNDYYQAGMPAVPTAP